MRTPETLTPQAVASAAARAARLLALGGTVRGSAPEARAAARRLLPLALAFVLGLAVGLGAGAGLLSEPSLTSDVEAGTPMSAGRFVDGEEE